MFKNNWNDVFLKEMQDKKYEKLMCKVDELYNETYVYPPKNKLFNAFGLTSFTSTKVVILGQDPYHGDGEAHGLAFSVCEGVKIPPSLRNIFKEINDEFEVEEIRKSGDLTNWANQGVLLLNASLSVEKDKANSHSKIGWCEFTDDVIKKLNDKNEPVVFVLWGSFAHKKEKFITNDRHLVLKGVHPSPLSAYRGFFGCNHFKLINEFLIKNKQEQIDW